MAERMTGAQFNLWCAIIALCCIMALMVGAMVIQIGMQRALKPKLPKRIRIDAWLEP